MTRTRFVNDYAAGPSFYGLQTGARFRVLCSDGIVRTAYATAEPDTMETIPARVSVHGRTVSGHVYHRGTFDYSRPGWPPYDDKRTIGSRTPLYRFSANLYGRNADALPEWAPSVRHG